MFHLLLGPESKEKVQQLSNPIENQKFCLFLTTLQGLQDLSSLTRDWTQTTAVEALSPNHWTTRDFLPNSLEYGRPSWTVFMYDWVKEPIFE